MARLSWLLAFASVAAVHGLASGPVQVRNLMRMQPNSVLEPRSNGTNSTANEPLECFQVATPVLSKDGAVTGNGPVLVPYPHGVVPSCELELMDHQFGNSYGQPFVAQYTPPPCNFTRVVMNFTVTSKGRQFDRLASMYLGDVEVWRTSTAEPTADPGIIWTVWKDMTAYLPLWRQNQTLIFDLGNLVNDQYTGVWSTKLHATFIDDSISGTRALPPDMVIALSAKKSKQNAPSAFKYPGDNTSVGVTLPRTVQRAVVAITANGQAEEEFWWSNVPDDAINVFQASTGPLLGDGSFREVRLRIDGQLAGLVWPFPVVFTGGISPPLHRPIVGPEAFDLREDEIDITPWLGVLCDGKQHNFSMEVVAANDAVVNTYWVLSGKIFVWLAKDESFTTGDAPTVVIDAPEYQSTQNSVVNSFVLYSQHVTRRLKITSNSLNIAKKSTDMTWQQSFSMTNKGFLNDYGNFQHVKAVYAGESKANADLVDYFYSGFAYPIETAFAITSPDGQYSLSIAANLTQGLDRTVTGSAVFDTGLAAFVNVLRKREGGSTESTTRHGSALFHQNKDGTSLGNGTIQQIFRFGATPLMDSERLGVQPDPLLYQRKVAAQSDVVTEDTTYVYKAPYTNQRVQVDASLGTKTTSGHFAALPVKEFGGAKVFMKNILSSDGVLQDEGTKDGPKKGANGTPAATKGSSSPQSIPGYQAEFEDDLIADAMQEVGRLTRKD